MNPELLQNIRFVCLDMDGTIYCGSKLFDCTIPFLNFLESNGIRYVFLTNNSSVSKDYYVAKLNRMGIPATREHFYTSTDYAFDYLHENMPGIRKLYLMATPDVEREFRQGGFELTEENPDAVMVTFDKTLTYEKLCKAAYRMRCGCPAFATHPDVFCPTDKPEWLVDCGAITAALEVSTGCRIHTLGKPDPGMLIHAAARYGIRDMKQVLMCGDRLSTDVTVGINAGAVSCHIQNPSSEISPVTGLTPDFSVAGLGELHEIWLKMKQTHSQGEK